MSSKYQPGDLVSYFLTAEEKKQGYILRRDLIKKDGIIPYWEYTIVPKEMGVVKNVRTHSVRSVLVREERIECKVM